MFFCFYNLDVCFRLRVIDAHNVCMRHTDVLLTAYENKLCSFNLWPLLEILMTLGQVLFVINVSIVFWNLSDGHLSKLSQTVRKLSSNSEIFYLYVNKSNPRLHFVSRYFTWLLDYKIASLQSWLAYTQFPWIVATTWLYFKFGLILNNYWMRFLWYPE